ncbi:MAG: HD-GYP domain-containing protein [Planctomycetota bacterium]
MTAPGPEQPHRQHAPAPDPPTADVDPIDIFTRELDEAFESLTLLYSLGSRVQSFQDPMRFITDALHGLRNVLGCAWAAYLADDNCKRLFELAGTFTIAGSDTADAVEAFVRSNITELAGSATSNVAQIADGPIKGELVVTPVLVGEKHAGWLLIGGGRTDINANRNAVSSADTQTAHTVAGFLGAMLDGRRLYEEQAATFTGALTALSGTLDAKDPYTQGHSERVAVLTRQIAERAKLDGWDPDRLVLAGRLHDIGKIGIPDRVLLKPDRLTDEEFDIIKQHPTIGHRILKAIPALEDVLPGVLHHHERFDGRGYPAGLAGDDIPPIARALALADTFDAMSSNRAYRPGKPRDVVLQIIRENAGTQFDPQLTEHFLALDLSEYDQLKTEHERSSAGNQQAA